jgi:hypothetical protein
LTDGCLVIFVSMATQSLKDPISNWFIPYACTDFKSFILKDIYIQNAVRTNKLIAN